MVIPAMLPVGNHPATGLRGRPGLSQPCVAPLSLQATTGALGKATGVRGFAAQARGIAAQARGVAAESRICGILEQDGWTVLLRRVRTACGEIDIVAELPDARLIAFIEVKARTTLSEAAGAVSARQRLRLLRSAGILIDRHPQWSGHGFRFDVILMDGSGRARRIADAFRIGDG